MTYDFNICLALLQIKVGFMSEESRTCTVSPVPRTSSSRSHLFQNKRLALTPCEQQLVTLHHNQQGDSYLMRRIDERRLCVTGPFSPLLRITDPLPLMIREVDPYTVSPATLDSFFPRGIDSRLRWLLARLTPFFSRCLTTVNPLARHPDSRRAS